MINSNTSLMPIEPEICYEIKLEGGNVVKWKDKAIVTEKVYNENPEIPQKEIQKIIRDKSGIRDLIMIKPEPGDFTGHADGMVRFLDSDTVLVNDYTVYGKKFKEDLKKRIEEKGLQITPFPYYPSTRKNIHGDYTADGCYINFLWIGKKIIIPTFEIKNEQKIIDAIKEILKDYEVHTLNSMEIAEYSGVLKCVGWGVKK